MNSVVMLTKDVQVDRRILLEADALERQGWSVRILAAPADDDMVRQDSRIERIPGGRAEQGGSGRERSVLALYRLARRLLPMNGRVMRALKALAWRHLVRQDEFFLRLFESSVAARPAAVYVAHDLPMLPVGVAAKRLHGARLVYDSHELYAEQEFSTREKRVWREIEARAIREADAVVTINPSVASELERRYGIEGVHVVYNAERAFAGQAVERRFHREFGLPDKARVLLMQGGLSSGRNIEQLVQAMCFVRTQDVHLVVMGDGQLKAQLRRLIAARNLHGRVHLKHAVPQADLVSWSAAADAGVIPYQPTCLNNYYCTPNKLFEFIAAGIPVLGSDLPEIRNIVAGHGIGEVADLSTPSNIASAIDAFFADTARLGAWRQAAAIARTTINWDVEARKFVQICEQFR